MLRAVIFFDYMPKNWFYTSIIHQLCYFFPILPPNISVCFLISYGSSSIRERIYCEKTSNDLGMCGVLIYTASGDSEGSLGGLVRQGEPNKIEDWNTYKSFHISPFQLYGARRNNSIPFWN